MPVVNRQKCKISQFFGHFGRESRNATADCRLRIGDLLMAECRLRLIENFAVNLNQQLSIRNPKI
jgi:hypothetical protein